MHEKAAPVKEPNLLEKAKLISDLAAAWQNDELAAIVAKMPNGDKVLEIFQAAINREMQMVMSGNRQEENAKQVAALASQVDKMGQVMAGFHQMMLAFMSSPLVQVLDLMNKNLGGRGAHYAAQAAQGGPQQPQRQQPMPQSEDNENGQPPGQRRATGLGSF